MGRGAIPSRRGFSPGAMRRPWVSGITRPFGRLSRGLSLIHIFDLFLKERILDPESNIQFGLGGAGTFSDGKLNTGCLLYTSRCV